MKLRRSISVVPPLLLLLALLAPSARGASTVRQGLMLCLETVIPSLFPFFVFSSLVISCGAADALSAMLAPVMRPLFHLGGNGASALVLGLLGGYPVGARTVCELYQSGQITKYEGEKLLSFVSNSGPGFILGLCGSIFSPRAAVYLYLVHASSALLTGVLLRGSPAPRRTAAPPLAAPHPLLSALPAAVTGALTGVMNVSAFVVFFMLLLSLLTALLPAAFASLPLYPLFLGFAELTNGITALPPSRFGFLLCAAMLSWGGCSVHCQTLALLADADLSPKPYLRGKIMQAVLSVPLAYLASLRLF